MGRDLTGNSEKSFLGNAAVVRSGTNSMQQKRQSDQKTPPPVGGIGNTKPQDNK